MTAFPMLEMFARFTAWDGLIIGGWLIWVAWIVRAEANRLGSVGQFRASQHARWVALILYAAGGGVAWLGWWLEHGAGPSIWGGLVALGWLIGWLNIGNWRKEGKPWL